jgi:acetyl esterase/lipase
MHFRHALSGLRLLFCLALLTGTHLFAAQEPDPAATASATTHSVIIQRDLAYWAGRTSDTYALERGKLDLYLPPSPRAPFPLLVWFHGGGLTGGGKDDPATQSVARRFAAQGVAVAVANYRLSPRAKYPAYIQDAAQAVQWCAAHATQWGGDRRAVYIGGHSAGGYLVAMLAMDEHYLRAAGLDPQSLAGVIPMSGQMVTHFTIRRERGIPNSDATIIADEAAPIFHLRAQTPRLLLLMGDNDWPARLEENQYFVAALQKVARNQQVSLVVVPNRDHGSIMTRCLEPGDPAGRAMLSFMHQPPRAN